MTAADSDREAADWGVFGWTARTAERCLGAPKYPDVDSYVRAVIRAMDPDHMWVCRGILEAGWNHRPPKVWAEECVRVQETWEEISPRPRRPGSPYNIDPSIFGRFWVRYSGRPWWGTALDRARVDGEHPRKAGVVSEAWDLANRGREGNTGRRPERIVCWCLLHPTAAHAIGIWRIVPLRRAVRWTPRLRWAVEAAAHNLGSPYPSVRFQRWWLRSIFWTEVRRVLSSPLAKYAPPGYWWWLYHRYVPSSPVLRSLSPDTVKSFSPRQYLKAYRALRAHDVPEEDSIRGAAGLVLSIGAGAWSAWLQYQLGRGVTAHDATHWLPLIPDEALGEILRRYKAQDLRSLAIVARAWWVIDSDTRSKGRLSDCLTAAMAVRYQDQQHAGLAAEAARWGVDPESYARIEHEWLLGLHELNRESIPGGVWATDGGWTLRRLAKDDPRGIFLGHHTGCCQHPEGQGAECAEHGHTQHNGGFVVIENGDGKIVAQAWVWRRNEGLEGDTLVLDSVETLLGDSRDRSRIWDLCYRGAAAQIGRLGIAYVWIGTRSGVGTAYRGEPCSVGISVYSDAEYAVRVLPGGDLEMLQKIERAAYPAAMRQMQNCRGTADLAEYCECDPDRIVILTGDSRTWYLLAADRGDEVEIVDLAKIPDSVPPDWDHIERWVKYVLERAKIIGDARKHIVAKLRTIACLCDARVTLGEPWKWNGEEMTPFEILR